MADVPQRLAPLYGALAPDPDAEYGAMPWSPWAVNRPGSAAWVQEGANPRFAMPGMVREGLKGILDLAAGTETGEVTPEAVQSLVFGGLGAGASMAPRGALASGAARPIRAYHGSPHDFERFDASKIGTGEGMQSFGHGLYFAENPAVARDYRETLSRSGREWGERALARENGDVDAAIAAIQAKIDRYRAGGGENYAKSQEDILRALQQYKKAGVFSGGHTYEVNLHTDPSRMINYDAPLAAQPRPVLDVARELKADLPRVYESDIRNELARLAGETPNKPPIVHNMPAPTNGRELYDNFHRMLGAHGATSEADAARMLAERGITGVRYLDGGSRAAGEGSRNYVMFPGTENLIEVLRKYGLAAPAPVAVPGALAPAGGQPAFRQMLNDDRVY